MRVIVGLAILAGLVNAALPAVAQEVTAEVRTWDGQSWRLTQPRFEVFYTIMPKAEEAPAAAEAAAAAPAVPAEPEVIKKGKKEEEGEEAEGEEKEKK